MPQDGVRRDPGPCLSYIRAIKTRFHELPMHHQYHVARMVLGTGWGMGWGTGWGTGWGMGSGFYVGHPGGSHAIFVLTDYVHYLFKFFTLVEMAW